MMILNDIKKAIRVLSKRKTYTFLGIFGFAIGLAVIISISAFVDQEFSMDTIYKNHQRIYRLVETNDGTKNADLDYNIYTILKENFPDVEVACPVRQKEKWPTMFHTKENYIKTKSFISTTNEFFDLFSVKIIKSLSTEPLPDKTSVVLSESTAKKLFPGTDALGQTITFFGNDQLIVSAIMEELPSKSSFKADLILNSTSPRYRFGRKWVKNSYVNPINHFVLLKEGVNSEYFAQKLNSLLPQFNSNHSHLSLQTMESIYFTEEINGNYNKKGNKLQVSVLITIGLLILVLSLFNYINFIFASQRNTNKITSISLIHGARFKHLISYYFTESAISLGISFALASGFLFLIFPFLNKQLSTAIKFNSIFSIRLVFITSSIILFVITIVAFLSTLSARNSGTSLLLKQKGSYSEGTSKSFLTVFQLSISIILIASVIGITKQLRFIQHQSLGFDSEQLLRLDPPPGFDSHIALKNRIQELSYVKNCSWSYGGPGFIAMEGHINHNNKNINIHGIGVDLDYLKTMGIECIEGRNFLTSDKEKSCLINEATIKALGCKDLDEILSVTKRITDKNIIGVVNDFNISSFHSEIEPTFLTLSDIDKSSLNIKLEQGNLAEQMSQIKSIWKELIPDHPLDITFYDEYFDSLYRTEERQGFLITFFSIVTILITCLGLLGQIFHQSLNRTKEIGVRKVNGAKISEILTLLNKDFVKWVAFAFILAVPVAWYAINKWLENFAYKTELCWWVFALAGLITLSISLLTVSFQSFKAATRNPVEALRYE